MNTEITSIRLPPKDSAMIEHFVKEGEFKSKSEFVRYAVKKTICDMMLKEFHEKLGKKGVPTEKEGRKILADIKEIRRELWREYAESLP